MKIICELIEPHSFSEFGYNDGYSLFFIIHWKGKEMQFQENIPIEYLIEESMFDFIMKRITHKLLASIKEGIKKKKRIKKKGKING